VSQPVLPGMVATLGTVLVNLLTLERPAWSLWLVVEKVNRVGRGTVLSSSVLPGLDFKVPKVHLSRLDLAHPKIHGIMTSPDTSSAPAPAPYPAGHCLRPSTRTSEPIASLSQPFATFG